ncbi:tetratricopeptide repeat protein [Bacillus weihaiensis]|uniref:tetratricopeptide repeat protein n=1 Tax=Bacillus weihaiensis TaxID=1547283 RepID=UPI0023550A59|nr:tetratricopeptide repeat protein [Bacillus weihaiensis]
MGKQLSKQQKKAQVVPFLQDGQYYYNKGLKAYREQNYQKASKYLEKALELDPNDATKLSLLATVYTDMGQYTQSNDLLLYILDFVDEDITECHYFMANNYAHLGLFQEAYKCATEYANKAPYGEFIEENEDLIDLLTMEEDDDDPFLKDPDDLILKQDAAKSLLESNQFQEAISLLEEIVEEYPEFWSAHNNLSLAYFYVGEVEKAKKFLQTVLERNPGNLHAYCNLLVFHYYERHDDKVEELAKALSNIHPLLFEHRYKLGATFALVGYYEQAYKWLRTLYRQGFEGDDVFYYWLSYAAYFTGNKNFSEQMWERVIKENKQKEGSEPWNVNQEVKQQAQNMSIEERLYAIFLSIKTDSLEEVERYKAASVPQSKLEQDFISFALGQESSSTDGIQSFYQIINRLFDRTKQDELFLYSFQILSRAYQGKCSLKNDVAWAASLEYVWRKQDSKEQVSQTTIASEYGTSSSTVRKYVNQIKELSVIE